MHEGMLPSHALGSLNPPDFPDSQATEDGCFWKQRTRSLRVFWSYTRFNTIYS